ncbi:MAG: sortase [Chloroflexota bacterium]|nr:sortase [Chloroflexota bacterium]
MGHGGDDTVQDVRHWLEEHVWAVATAGLAAIVFGVTFIAVSTASDSPQVEPDPVVITVEPETPDPEAAPAAETPPDAADDPPDTPSDAPADEPARPPSDEARDDPPAAGEEDPGDPPAAAPEQPSPEGGEEPAVAAPIEPEPDDPASEGEEDTRSERGDGARGSPAPPGVGPDYEGPDRPLERPETGEEERDADTEATPAEPDPPETSTPPERPERPARPSRPARPEPPAEPAGPPPTLPEFDEEALIYGGTGWEGAILAGPGIVWSSRSSARTSWELLMPSAQIKASLVRVGLTWNRAMGAPDNPHVIGWWEGGPEPGETGNVLLAGHRDYTDTQGNIGVGVCWLLDRTALGDFLIIRDSEQREHYVYTVTEVVSVRWNDPNGVAYLRPSDTAIVTLVTCEGAFDRDANNYSNRRIVVAEMTDIVPFTDEAG